MATAFIRMNEKTLAVTAYIVFVVGIVFLLLYADEFEVQNVATLENRAPAETVKMQGVVTRVTIKDAVTFAEIEGERVEKTSIVVFTQDDVYLKEGQYVEVEGKVEDYNGKKEIIANKVIVK